MSIVPPPEPPLPTSTHVTLDELSRWALVHPQLTEQDHALFEAKFPLVYREKLAAMTKARGTLKDALSWLRKLHPAPNAKPNGDVGVPEVTMSLMVESTRRLAVAVESMNLNRTDDTIVLIEAARTAVNHCYHDTKFRLESAIGRNPTWHAQLSECLNARHHNELDGDAARLLRLRDLIDTWLTGSDPLIKHSLSIEGITAKTTATCTRAATELTTARASVTGVKDTGRDSPVVNQLEGAVLVLMQAIHRAVNAARERKTTQLVLIPGAATKRIVAPPRTSKATPVVPPT